MSCPECNGSGKLIKVKLMKHGNTVYIPGNNTFSDDTTAIKKLGVFKCSVCRGTGNVDR